VFSLLQKKSDNVLVAYAQILFLDWLENRNVEWLQHSKSCLRFLTSEREKVSPAERDVYLTPLYFNSIDLAKSYPGTLSDAAVLYAEKLQYSLITACRKES